MSDEIILLIVLLAVALIVGVKHVFAVHRSKAPNTYTNAQIVNHLRAKNVQNDMQSMDPWSDVSIGSKRGGK